MNKCPYCNSEDVTLTINTDITGKLDKNGNIILDENIYDVIKYSTHTDKYGWCNNCKRDITVDNDLGYVIGEDD